jgi:hypothetical protein
MNKIEIPTSEDLLRRILSNCNLEAYEIKDFDPELFEQMLTDITEHVNIHVQIALNNQR